MTGRKILSYCAVLLVGAIVGGGVIYRAAMEHISERAAWDELRRVIVADPSKMMGAPDDMDINVESTRNGALKCKESALRAFQASIDVGAIKDEHPGKPVLLGGDHWGPNHYVFFVGVRRAADPDAGFSWAFACLMRKNMDVRAHGLLLPDGKNNLMLRETSIFDIEWSF